MDFSLWHQIIKIKPQNGFPNKNVFNFKIIFIIGWWQQIVFCSHCRQLKITLNEIFSFYNLLLILRGTSDGNSMDGGATQAHHSISQSHAFIIPCTALAGPRTTQCFCILQEGIQAVLIYQLLGDTPCGKPHNNKLEGRPCGYCTTLVRLQIPSIVLDIFQYILKNKHCAYFVCPQLAKKIWKLKRQMQHCLRISKKITATT